MAEVVAVEPLGGLITFQNKPIQSSLPAEADAGRCFVNPASTEHDCKGRLRAAVAACYHAAFILCCSFFYAMFLCFIHVCAEK